MNKTLRLSVLAAWGAATLAPAIGIAGGTAPEPKTVESSAKAEEKLKAPFFTWKPGDPLSFADGKITFDIQERLRMELRNNNFDFNDSVNGPQDDTFLLQRFRLGALFKPVEWLKFYASGQDSREWFSEDRPDTPFVFGSEGDDSFDLREAWVEAGNLAEFPVSAKIGRQVLIYGDERLVGGFDWNNFGRTFDAAKFTFQVTQKFSVDVFGGSVVNIEGNEPLDGDDGWEFNESDWNRDVFYGVYATDKGGWVGFQQTELFFLGRNKSQNEPFYSAGALLPGGGYAYDLEQDTYTFGAHVKSTSTGRLKGFDYEADIAYQFGNGSLPATGLGGRAQQSALDLGAFAAHAAVGYNFELAPWTPRVGLDYAVATGDENPDDNKSQSFMNLFPTNHKFYGEMDAFAWKNIHNPSVNVTVKPNSKITLKAAYHLFWLYTNEDAWYRANAVSVVRPVTPAAREADNFVGSEVDLVGTYAYSKWLTLQAGYSHFFSSDYVRQTSPTGADDDADFFYLQSTLKF
jgi:hypothetical protein